MLKVYGWLCLVESIHAHLTHGLPDIDPSISADQIGHLINIIEQPKICVWNSDGFFSETFFSCSRSWPVAAKSKAFVYIIYLKVQEQGYIDLFHLPCLVWLANKRMACSQKVDDWTENFAFKLHFKSRIHGSS